ncbi:MAG: outer membrane protein assembly factor BamA [Zetaproteobacteria bacterium]|nr:MAG: outer membrane protein assembly factor BamA [Zetaproteobacteria bacterium]
MNALKRITCLTLLVSAFFTMGMQVKADDGIEQLRVTGIEVSGNRYIEKETVLDKISVKKGDFVDRRSISRDVKAIYETGFFSDVKVIGHRKANGVVLEYHVEEYPLIANVDIEGNDEVSDKDLSLRLRLKPGQIFSPANVRADIDTIRKGYLKKGYYQVAVRVDAKPAAEEGRVNVSIIVDEGMKTHIRRIHFIGNREVDDRTLRSTIVSREQSLATWITDRDIFDRKRIAGDVQMIEQYYQNRGFVDARVESTTTRLSSDKSGFDLTYSIHEGPRYTIGQIKLQGDLIPDEETLRELIEFQSGDVYSLNDLRVSLQKLTERVGDEGYAFATITPLFHRDIDKRIVDITFDIQKGREVYVERIEIAGNETTNDEVLRRELRQDEGARYAASQVRRSKERLKRIEYIEDVRVAKPKGSSDKKTKLRFDVTEKKSGSFSFGIGYSQLEKAFIQAKLNEKNVLGLGYQASINGTFGAKTQNFQMAFTDPYFFGQDVSATLSGYRNDNRLQQFTSYDSISSGASLSFGIPLTEHLTYGLGYNFESTDLRNIPKGASILLQAQAGKQTTGMVFQSLSYDTRNSVLAPTSGTFDQIGLNYAGVGGKNRFWEGFASAAAYASFGDENEFTLAPRIEGRVIRPLKGKNLPLNRRYSLGGVGTVRGFDSYGISLRDPVTGEPVGGDRSIVAAMNLFFPVPGMRTAGFRGVLFADAGMVWGHASATVGAKTINVTERFSMSKMRVSLGWGFEWMSPLGPLGFVWGFPVRTQPGDIKRQFEFAIGANF